MTSMYSYFYFVASIFHLASELFIFRHVRVVIVGAARPTLLHLQCLVVQPVWSLNP